MGERLGCLISFFFFWFLMSEKTDIKNVIKLLASIMGYLGYYGIDDPPPPLYKKYFCIKIIYWKEVKYIDIIAQSIHEKTSK